MLVIPDRNVEQVLSFISSMKNSDQDFCITNQNTLEKFQAKDLNKVL